MKDRTKLAIIITTFLAAYFIPFSKMNVQKALLEAFFMLQDYAREHVLFCLVPAFFIAGAIAVFVNQAAVMKYFGAQAKNLREYRFDLKLTPNKAFTLKGEYHYFMLDGASDAWYYPGKAVRRDRTGASGRELGHEIDVTARIKVTKYFELLTGSCFFIPGGFVKNTGNSPRASWYFLETTISF